MQKPHVILVHGMGTPDEVSFKASVTKPLNKASEYFSGIGKFEEEVVLHYIEYDSIFEEVRQKIADFVLP